MTDEPQGFSCAPDPEHPGWLRWRLNDPKCYNEAVLGRMLARIQGDKARIRIFPVEHLTNNVGNIHGAATLGLIDISLFAAGKLLRDVEPGGSVTIGIDTQFIGAGDAGKPLDAVVEVLRETGRMIFLRGLVVQDETIVAAFNATTRKPPRQ